VHVRSGKVVSEELTRCRAELAEVRSLLAASDGRFRRLFAESPIGIGLADEHGRIVQVNAAMCRVFGRGAEDLVGRLGTELTYPADRAVHTGIERAQQDSPDGVARVEVRCLYPDGSVRWIELTVSAVPGPHGEHWTLCYGQDVTARKTAELELRESRAALAAIASVSRSVQLGHDPRPALLAAARRLSGASSAAIVERSRDGTLAVTGYDGRACSVVPVRPTGTSVTSRAWNTATLFRWTDGDVHASTPDPSDPIDLRSARSVLWQPVVVHNTVHAVLVASWEDPITDALEHITGAITMLAAETGMSLQAAQLRAELEASAYTDPMTGALNRRAWDSALHALAADAARTDQPLAIALIDLDHFKAYNDEFGHNAGDVLLRTFADAARRCLRSSDVFARWGGEEFIIALPNCNPDQAHEILHRVRVALRERRTCSIGLTYWNHGESLISCVARADAALYDAKHFGRDRISVR
jgi:diguanylate cyclase (GGDEF)-like protein/PAS domain S-box-containing protein